MEREIKSRDTYSKKIRRANILMVATIIIFIVLINVLYKWAVSQYANSVEGLQNLRSFYLDLETHTQFVKEYLYNEDEKKLAEIEEINIAINKNLENMISLSPPKEKWQFKALKNMYNAYIESNNDLIINYQNNTGYEKAYNIFLHSGNLVLETSGEYYGIMIQIINDQLSNLKIIQRGTSQVSVLLLVILVVWLLYYSYQLTHSFSEPITQLLQNINKIKEGEYNLSQVSNSSIEIEELCIALNEMSISIKENIENQKIKAELEKQLLISKNESIKKDELLAQSELKMLQNQINPHFLFNTINMIYRMAINEGANEAANMMIQLSQLLRYGLDNQRQTSTLAKEIDMIKKYIEIQNKRLGDRIHFVVESDDNLSEMEIPGLIFQPLVENALIHGLQDVTENGEVFIEISEDEKMVKINIADNGKGMSAMELEEMILNDYQKKDGNHFGLYNVIKRLEMHFKNRVQFRLNSDEGCGFEVNIAIRKDDFDEIQDFDSGR